ncbi:hypothetical protein MY10362_004054 [Beauveria mimosiformis]
MASFLHRRLHPVASCILAADISFSTQQLRKPDRELDSNKFKMGLVNAKNNVPQHQRFYQQAYKAHTRLWMINSRSRWYMTPYLICLWGTFGVTLYAAGRKITGHNTYFGKD